jgi:hypothetical protein
LLKLENEKIVTTEVFTGNERILSVKDSSPETH